MNNTYYETLDENFINALKFYETEYTHEELISMLQNGNIPQRQIAALKLDTIKSEHEAAIFLSNLTGQDGKIREAISLQLKEFMSNKNLFPYFKTNNSYSIFLDAITDINGNICRNVIDAISNIADDEEFCEHFCPQLVKLTLDLLKIVEKFNFKDGKYKVNKDAFKLYWCLETINVFANKIDTNDIKEIILRSKDIGEYTIREKTAKILTHKFDDQELISAREQLKNDVNYYVRRF